MAENLHSTQSQWSSPRKCPAAQGKLQFVCSLTGFVIKSALNKILPQERGRVHIVLLCIERSVRAHWNDTWDQCPFFVFRFLRPRTARRTMRGISAHSMFSHFFVQDEICENQPAEQNPGLVPIRCFFTSSSDATHTAGFALWIRTITVWNHTWDGEQTAHFGPTNTHVQTKHEFT